MTMLDDHLIAPEPILVKSDGHRQYPRSIFHLEMEIPHGSLNENYLKAVSPDNAVRWQAAMTD